jgi:hypothetical protein
MNYEIKEEKKNKDVENVCDSKSQWGNNNYKKNCLFIHFYK